MGLLKAVVKFVSDPKPVAGLGELEAGRACVEGVVRLGNDGEILSPVTSRPCVAFYYRAFAVSPSRGGGYIPRRIRSAEVYGSFDLEVDGGRIKAVPTRSDEFAAADHRELSGKGYDNFRATEDLISPGTKVRVWGRAKREGDSFVLRYTKIEILARGPGDDAASGAKKKKTKSRRRARA